MEGAKKVAQLSKKPYSTPSTSISLHPGGPSKRNLNGRKRAHPSMNGGKLTETEAKDSSSSGSSDSGSSSSGEESSSSSSGDSTPRPSSFWNEDELGGFIEVTCAGNEAKFYKNRFARGSIGRCVWFKGQWITPNEFQAISGRQSSKDWKRSIRLDGKCLKEYISVGLFREHDKTCKCSICMRGREDEDLRRQEGVIALAAKRRRLSQAGVDSSHGSSGASHASLQHQQQQQHDTESGIVRVDSGDSEHTEGTLEKKLPGSSSSVKRNKRGRPPKNQRVWSPSGEVAQEVSSNEEEYRPIKDLVPLLDSDTVDPVIDVSDFLPRRSQRCRQSGYRTELGTYTRKPIDWDTEEVSEFMRLQGFAEYADSFQEYDINGQSMFLLKEHHLLERFTMKLGPTLRLLDTISRLRHPPLV